jgi:hypothetical protein
LIPNIQDVPVDTLQTLELAMVGSPTQGKKFEIALAQTDPNRPYFYVATNLPDQTKLDLILIGNGETLLNRLQFSAASRVTTTFGLGKSEPILALGANPIPKGEYQVFLVEANEASPPSAVSPGTNFLFNKTFFIGGPRDETYLTRLKAFHEKIKQSAERESQELKQYSDTLQMQFQMLTQEFSKYSKVQKPSPRQMAAWAKTVTSWKQLNGQMEQTIQTWTPETLQNEFFYGKTYENVKGSYESLQKLFNMENAFLEPAARASADSANADRNAFDIQHGKATSEARDSLDLLKNRVEAILKAPKTASGLPTREES